MSNKRIICLFLASHYKVKYFIFSAIVDTFIITVQMNVMHRLSNSKQK